LSDVVGQDIPETTLAGGTRGKDVDNIRRTRKVF